MIVIHSLHGGGAERVAVDLGAYWVEQGYTVTLVTQAPVDMDAYALHARVRRKVLGTAGSSSGHFPGLLANLRRVLKLRRIIRRERPDIVLRSEEHTSELQSLMRISYAVFCLK